MNLKIHLVESFLHMQDVFCRHLDQAAAMSHNDRIAQIAPGGRKLARNNPTECKYWSHWQSESSVFRPGTFFTCCVLTR
jgi:hypothetical protein